MPLPAYGVAIGTFVRFERDPRDRYGRWYHGHLTIATPDGTYEAALDVDTPTGVGVSYRVSRRRIDPGRLGPVAGLADGFHLLASTPASGARDYLRDGLSMRAWVRSTGDNALRTLEGHLPTSTRLYVFGERFEDGGRGVHDVHANQGDPVGSQWYDTDGIWQDGAVFATAADGRLFAWEVRFNSQALATDDDGHPL